MEITAATLVADIAAHHPRSIEVFERHGIDFCCGGRRALGEACRAHGTAVEAVAAEIAAAAAREVPADRVFTDAPSESCSTTSCPATTRCCGRTSPASAAWPTRWPRSTARATPSCASWPISTGSCATS